MASDIVPEPGVVADADLDSPSPKPADVVGSNETPNTVVSLSPGWIAVTDREFLTFHPKRDPAVSKTLRANVTGLLVKRTGGRSLLGYAPKAIVYAVGASAVGGLMLTVSPESLITVPDAPGSGRIETIVRTLGWGMDLLGAVLLFTGILAGLIAVAVVGYCLLSKEVAFVLERGDADPIECPTTRSTGKRALRELQRNGIGESAGSEMDEVFDGV